VFSIVIPAHNEERVLGRLLAQLTPSPSGEEADIVVVANGCTDGTVEVATTFSPRVRVFSIPSASKREALVTGNRVAKGFPRLYIDADVELRADDARALAEALNTPGVLGAGPEREHSMAGLPWAVRWYYDVWTRLPEVKRGLFGRGVVGVSAEGYLRMSQLPPLLADDLAPSLVFSPDERIIVPGTRVIVHPPRTVGDLVRSRARAMMGADQVERAENGLNAIGRTRLADVAIIARRDPRLVPRACVFMVVALLARRQARRVTARSGYSTWLQDRSSREGASQMGELH
jgi:glycosyltransferase involved in cell wall biosynthesis